MTPAGEPQRGRADADDDGPLGTAGYAHPRYAAALSEFGTVVLLPRSGGSLLRRSIPGTDLSDLCGPYPLFACADWAALGTDLAELEGAVSVVVVADPLGRHDEALLRDAFPDLVRPFKRHYVADLTVPLDRRLSPNHRRNLRKVPPDLRTERVADPGTCLDDWARLYETLVARHEIRGIAAFSKASFEQQFRVPGLRAWRAEIGGATVGMVLWYVAGTFAYYHLTAVAPDGYRARCVYPLLRHALEDLAAEGVLVAELGGAAGLDDDPSDGLAAFKQGWSTGTVVAHLCGRVLDRDAYDRLSQGRSAAAAAFFPAYRGR